MAGPVCECEPKTGIPQCNLLNMTEQEFPFEVSFWSFNAWWPTSATAASWALPRATAVSPWASSTSSPVPSTSRVIVCRSSNVWRTGGQVGFSLAHQMLGMDMEGYRLRINRRIWSHSRTPRNMSRITMTMTTKVSEKPEKKQLCWWPGIFWAGKLVPCSAHVPMFKHPSSLPELRWPIFDLYNRPPQIVQVFRRSLGADYWRNSRDGGAFLIVCQKFQPNLRHKEKQHNQTIENATTLYSQISWL